MGVMDPVAMEAATFMGVTQADIMDAVATSLAVAIGADTAGTGEPMVAMADTIMDPVL